MRGVEQIPFAYDALMTLCEAFGLGRWRRWLAEGAQGRILDLGCGTGRSLPHFPPGCLVVGLDPSAEALARARRRAPHVPLVRARAGALPFREGVFDTVVSGLVFCSVDEPARGLGEVKRVLEKDGRLRMLEHVRSTSWLKGRWQDFIQPAWTRVTGGCRPNRQTEAVVEQAGFQIEPASRRAKGELRRFSARNGSSR